MSCVDLLGMVLQNHTKDAMPKVMDAISTGLIGEFNEEVLYHIQRWKQCTRPEILRQMSRKMSARDLDEILRTLSESGQICEYIKGRQRMYRSIGEGFVDQILSQVDTEEKEIKDE